MAKPEFTNQLLREAIADAEAVRQTAIENAKLSLEETFTPQIKSMLSRRLRAEAEGMEHDKEEEKEVEKKEVPIHVLEKIVVFLKDGTEVPVNIKELLKQGADPDVVEKELNNKLEALELYIQNVNFYIDLEQIEKTVQQETDKILNKFKL